ncbi:MAG: hypothetical protein HY669_02695 [Chloroflexi bacterium]|nr:hypothetical protein [Chloroflexota bacterium]
MLRVGIPRALLYYQYFPMWQVFFEHLGVEVVVSPTTTKSILAQGSSRMVAETCLPVKIFAGHVLSLVGQCDYLFVPAIRSVEHKVYNCSKFLALPDLVKAVVPESPPILDVDVDVNRGKRDVYLAIYQLGRRFTWNPARVKAAADAAWRVHLEYQDLMRRNKLTPVQAMSSMQADSPAPEPEPQAGTLPVAVVGHPYLIHDEFINHRLLHRLQQLGARTYTADMVPETELDAAVANVVNKPYWTYETEVVGAGGYYLESQVAGVIGVAAFGCGPDSLMMDMVQRYSRRLGSKPFMSLTLDEHTAEAGLLTRLEAFLDMVRRRQRGKASLA